MWKSCFVILPSIVFPILPLSFISSSVLLFFSSVPFSWSRHMATIHFGNQPNSCSQSWLSHDNPLILFFSFCCLASASFLTFPLRACVTFPLSASQQRCVLLEPLPPPPSPNAFSQRAHFDPLSSQSFVFPTCSLVGGQVNCRHYSAAAHMICLDNTSPLDAHLPLTLWFLGGHISDIASLPPTLQIIFSFLTSTWCVYLLLLSPSFMCTQLWASLAGLAS